MTSLFRIRKCFCLLGLVLGIPFQQFSLAQSSLDTIEVKKFITSIKLNYTYANFQNFYRYNTFMNGLPFPMRHYSLYGAKAIGLAFKSNKNLNSHEIEVNSLGFITTTSKGSGEWKSNGKELTVRYQFTYSFCKKPDAFIYPYAGISAILGFLVESSKYKDSWYESKQGESSSPEAWISFLEFKFTLAIDFTWI